MVKNERFWNNSKNIDIWILRKEQNLFISEFYMFVPNLVKIDWEMAAKNPRLPPRNLVFLSFQHQTAVISRASSRSPCPIWFQSGRLWVQIWPLCLDETQTAEMSIDWSVESVIPIYRSLLNLPIIILVYSGLLSTLGKLFSMFVYFMIPTFICWCIYLIYSR